ncbi:hypothetical protein NW768_002505 [Fusarium equiseti]|uniref:Transcription factor n=1 Tax=Fusarium equiseti TaxID=61235 RepID=A0ABQ8RNM3_FUSEQ|nr:hypothetical protein NW768_002505 [Fusarium equiseti]
MNSLLIPDLNLLLFKPAHPEPESSLSSTPPITAMEHPTQGQETSLPLIQPPGSVSVAPAMYENDKIERRPRYEPYRPASTVDDTARCTNQDAATKYSVGIYRTPPDWRIYACDSPILDPAVVNSYAFIMNEIGYHHSLSMKLCEERAELRKLVHACEQDMLRQNVAFGGTWGYHNMKRVKWMEKMEVKQKELELSYETTAALMERLAKVQAEFWNLAEAEQDAENGEA